MPMWHCERTDERGLHMRIRVRVYSFNLLLFSSRHLKSVICIQVIDSISISSWVDLAL